MTPVHATDDAVAALPVVFWFHVGTVPVRPEYATLVAVDALPDKAPVNVVAATLVRPASEDTDPLSGTLVDPTVTLPVLSAVADAAAAAALADAAALDAEVAAAEALVAALVAEIAAADAEVDAAVALAAALVAWVVAVVADPDALVALAAAAVELASAAAWAIWAILVEAAGATFVMEARVQGLFCTTQVLSRRRWPVAL